MLRNLLVTAFFTALVVGFPACGNEVATGTQSLSCSGQTHWVQPLTGAGSARVRALAALADGTFAVAGHFDGRLVLPGLSAGSLTLTSAGGQDGFVARFNQDGLALWATRLGGPGDDRATAITTLTDGTVVVVGSFEQGAVFGPESKAVVLAPQGARDGFVAWLDVDGQLERAQSMETAGRAESTSVAAQPDGSVVVGGTEWREELALVPASKLPRLRTWLSWPYGHGALATSTRIDKERDPELPPARFPIAETMPRQGYSPLPQLSAVPLGRGGYVPWLAQLPGSLGHSRVPRPLATLTRFSRAGERLLAPVFDGTGQVTSLRALAGGGFVVAGEFTGVLTVGGADKGKYALGHAVCAGCTPSQRDTMLQATDEGVAQLEAYGLGDIFVAAFDASGRLGWSHRLGAVDELTHSGTLAVASDGAVWLGAVVQRHFAATSTTKGGEQSRLALVRVDASELRAPRTYAYAESLSLGALVSMPDGGLAVLGGYTGMLNLSVGPYWVPIAAQGGQDGFLARLDALGEPMWLKGLSGSEDQEGEALLALPDGSVVVGGAFSGTAAFGTSTEGIARTAEGSSDAFLWRLQ